MGNNHIKKYKIPLNKRLKLSQRTNKSKKDEENDEILNTINSKFDTIPYYEIFRYK